MLICIEADLQKGYNDIYYTCTSSWTSIEKALMCAGRVQHPFQECTCLRLLYIGFEFWSEEISTNIKLFDFAVKSCIEFTAEMYYFLCGADVKYSKT